MALAVIITSIALGTAACGGSSSNDSDAANVSSDNEPAGQLSGPRIVVTYDGGVRVLERDTLKTVADFPMDGFLRVNKAGDERHVFVSTETKGFQLLDTGVEVESHGDHAHYLPDGKPELGKTFEAPEPGHVTVHDGKTVLWSDGAGTAQVLDTEDPTEVEETYKAPSPHHGVAVQLEDGLLVTEGTTDKRTGAKVVDDGRTIASSNQCPGVHGEATAGNGAAVIGCENGVLVFDQGEFTKIDSPDSYGRIGNQAGSPSSPIVLGDYKVDKDAELERPERITLIDTETKKLKTVDLGTSYSFRSLGRGAAGEAIILGTDGALHVLDAKNGSTLSTIKVVKPWMEPVDWKQPRPTLHVSGDTAWVTEPATSTVHVVNIPSGKVTDSVKLDVMPDELISG
ncbi:zinc metallochaperone AztD [Aeromicrobium sp. NPDC092404]|uniref:zinc metallochaperone AztD n=1 Tax=Aeromicrobium sp. NPDC092404 TaxID=3154976 RepID=UPI0034209B5B